MEQGNRKVQYLVALSVSIATVTMGVSSAWPTPVIPKFHNNETNLAITKEEISWMLAVTPPGFIAGSFIMRFTSEYFGRRATLLSSALPFAIGTLILALGTQAWLLYITRILWGVGTGMISSVAPIYIAEIADKDIRGTLSIITRFMFNFGNLLVMSIGPFVSYQVLNYMLLALPVLYFIACWWIPESPYYNMKEGKVDSARKGLMLLRGYQNETELEKAVMLMQSDVKQEMRHSSTVKELFTGKQYRKPIIIATGLKITQILSGGMPIQQYLGKIMQDSKIEMSISTILLIFGGVNFIVGIMSSMLVDRVGRRPLLIFSFLGTSSSLACVGLYFFLQEVIQVSQNQLAPYAYLAFIGIIAATVISTLGFNSLSGVIPAEIFPLNIKAVAMTSLNIFGGILGFTVAKTYQKMVDTLGMSGMFWIFAAVAFSGAVFGFIFVPETRGKSLKEIQIMLQGDIYQETDEKLNNIVTDGATDSERRDLNEIELKERSP